MRTWVTISKAVPPTTAFVCLSRYPPTGSRGQVLLGHLDSLRDPDRRGVGAGGVLSLGSCIDCRGLPHSWDGAWHRVGARSTC